MLVTALCCEYRLNPMGIDVPRPRLGWQLQSSRRGARQSAYQILVGRSESDLLQERALLWDTGKVASDQCTHVPYKGEPSQSGQRLWWKVRVWDESDQVTAYSAPAWWEMGLLERSAWEGQWIGGPLAGGIRTPAPSPFLRKTFEVNDSVSSARLYITALGLYECHINGQAVGDDVLTPGWTDFGTRVRYQVHDITDLLIEGENTIGAILGDGWYCGNLERSGRMQYGDRPRLLAQLHITLADDSTVSIATDETWRIAYGPILAGDLLMGETYDARREFPGWDEPGFDDARWQPAEPAPDPGIALVANNGPTMRRIQELVPIAEPTEIGTWPNSRWIFDFGQNMVGRVRLKVQGPAGTNITLRHAEMLDADRTLYTENLRSAQQTDDYTLRGDGVEFYEPRFTFHGFQFVEISGFPGRPSRDTLTGIVLHSDMAPAGSFECSDPLINQLQHNIIWGQKGNFLDVPTDCPQRDERLGWTGDAQVFIRTAAFNMDVAGFFTKWMQDVIDAQYPSGAVPSVAPITRSFRDRGESNGGPAWADAVVICPWTTYLCYGDRQLLETHYDSLALYIDFLKSRRLDVDHWTEAGAWQLEGYGDWLALDGGEGRIGATPKDLIATAFIAHSSRLMSCIAAVLDKPGAADEYEALFNEVRDLFIARYVTPQGRLVSQTQTAYVLALHFELLPENLRPAAVNALVHEIERRDCHLSTGFVGSPYLPHVLTKAGRADIAYALLNQQTWPSWLYPITQGATTIWERWDGWTHDRGFQDARMNSFNHYAYGSIGAWMYANVAGIDVDPEVPGYKHILLRPFPGGGLTSAQASYDSLYGRIVSAWRIDDDVLDWRIQVPPNTTATVTVPAREDALITEGDVPAAEAQGVTLLRREPEATVYSVQSGDYHFSATQPVIVPSV
ncbi:MAG: family 78 glycoside hydrolase catalytic domain [Anaerolineae bacterium]